MIGAGRMGRLALPARAVALAGALALSRCAPAATGTGASAPASAAPTAGPRAGAAASDFAARDVDGRTVRLSDFLGRSVVLIDFWATWCQPCTAEMPHLRRLYDAYRAKGFVILAVSMDGPETIAEVPMFAKRNAMTFPVLLDEDSRVASVFNPRKAAPLSVLIGRDGRILGIHESYNPGDEDVIAAEVARAVDGATR